MTTDAITVAPLIVRNNQLSIEDLKKIPFQMTIQGDNILFEYSKRNFKLRTPITVNLQKVLAAKEKGLVEYIFNTFLADRPALIPYVF